MKNDGARGTGNGKRVSDFRVILAACILIALSSIWSATALWGMPRHTLHNALVALIPYSFSIHAAMLAAALCASAWRARNGIRANARFIGAASIIAVIGLAASLLLAPKHHRLYFDEDIYIQIGHSIAVDGKAGLIDCAVPSGTEAGWTGTHYYLNKEPSGLPFMISLVSRIIGVCDEAGMYASLLAFAAGIFGMSYLSRESGLFRGSGVYIPALLFALWPENLRWSVCAVAEVPAQASAIWALALGMRAGRTGARIDAWAALLAVGGAVQFRPEGPLLLLPFMLCYGFSGPRGTHAAAKCAVSVAVIFLITLPNMIHIASVSGESWGSSGPKFSTVYVWKNLVRNVGWWFHGEVIGNTFPAPPLAAYCALAGGAAIAVRILREGMRSVITRHAAAVLAWFALFFGIFIPFYAGSYYYGVDVRFSLLALPPVMLFAGVAIQIAVGMFRLDAMEWKSFAAAAVVILLIMWFGLLSVPFVTDEARQAREEHAAVIELNRSVPADAIVISNTPATWANQRRASMQLLWALANPHEVRRLASSNRIMYHWNYWDIAPIPGTVTNDGRHLLSGYPEAKEYSKVEAQGKWVFKIYDLE